MTSRATSWPRPLAIVFVGIALLLWFIPLGLRDLITPDEGRYAELARGILTTGDWITPRLNGLIYFEKPPLQYWLTAISFKLFGLNAFTARLWPALAGALTIVAVWWCAKRFISARVGLFAACCLASSLWWVGNSHFLNLDTSLSCFLTLSMLGFWAAQRDEASAAQTRAGMLVCWAAMAFAVLSKGLVGALIPGAVLFLYVLIERDFALLRRLHWWSGLALFIVIAAPWFVLVSSRNPAFAEFFFIHEHFTRFLTQEHRRVEPWYYFIPILLAGALPWTSLLPGALWAGWQRQAGRFQANRLFILWIGFVMLFFSASGSKLPSYVLPVFPPLALLIGQRLGQLPPSVLRRHIAAIGLFWLLMLGLVWAFADRLDPQMDVFDLAFRQWAIAACGVLAAGAIGAWWLARQRSIDAAIIGLAFSALLGMQIVATGHQSYAPRKSSRQLAALLQREMPPGAPVYSVMSYDQTLPFYLGRPVVLVQYVDEFELGQRLEPTRSIASLTAFTDLWKTLPAGAAVFSSDDVLNALQRTGVPMRIIELPDRKIAFIK